MEEGQVALVQGWHAVERQVGFGRMGFQSLPIRSYGGMSMQVTSKDKISEDWRSRDKREVGEMSHVD